MIYYSTEKGWASPPWKTMDAQEQRVRFVIEAAEQRRTFGALCAPYEISRPTGYLWLQRHRE